MIRYHFPAYFIIAGISIIVLAISLVSPGDGGLQLYLEDGPVENIAALFLLLTIALGLILGVVSKINRAFLLLVALTGLAGFLFEIGFGSRLDFFDMPAVFGITKQDIHNLFRITYGRVHDFHDSNRLLFYIIACLGTASTVYLAFRYSYLFTGFTGRSEFSQPIIFAALFVGLFLTGTLLDLAKVNTALLIGLEETLELDATIALFFCLVSLYNPGKSNR